MLYLTLSDSGHNMFKNLNVKFKMVIINKAA
jgi:hypothetical protein